MTPTGIRTRSDGPDGTVYVDLEALVSCYRAYQAETASNASIFAKAMADKLQELIDQHKAWTLTHHRPPANNQGGDSAAGK